MQIMPKSERRVATLST